MSNLNFNLNSLKLPKIYVAILNNYHEKKSPKNVYSRNIGETQPSSVHLKILAWFLQSFWNQTTLLEIEEINFEREVM